MVPTEPELLAFHNNLFVYLTRSRQRNDIKKKSVLFQSGTIFCGSPVLPSFENTVLQLMRWVNVPLPSCSTQAVTSLLSKYHYSMVHFILYISHASLHPSKNSNTKKFYLFQ